MLQFIHKEINWPSQLIYNIPTAKLRKIITKIKLQNYTSHNNNNNHHEGEEEVEKLINLKEHISKKSSSFDGGRRKWENANGKHKIMIL